MIHNVDKKDLIIGISACLIGEKVRFDASNKPSNFCINDLGHHVTYKSFCPEVAVGLPIPRPTIRQIKHGEIIRVSCKDGSQDVTEELKIYGEKVSKATKNLSGYVFCAKSPSCGMERVKVYSPEGHSLKSDGIGAFAREIMRGNPLLPCEENGRLNDPVLRENFVARVYAYKHWQDLEATGLTKHKLTSFHSQYKYTVMSHDLIAYKSLGQLLARADMPLEKMAAEYISGLMKALTIRATRTKHANTLAHLQGYFSKNMQPHERKELCEQIDAYRKGIIPLFAPLTLIKHYLLQHPNDYLTNQAYLAPYPDELKLRYAY